jgi:hypothetical protein
MCLLQHYFLGMMWLRHYRTLLPQTVSAKRLPHLVVVPAMLTKITIIGIQKMDGGGSGPKTTSHVTKGAKTTTNHRVSETR